MSSLSRPVRVRFAPSPTGPLHIGGLRTALYNYLFARKHGGTFMLRIEDTDQERFVLESEAYIREALEWVGITPDEGPDGGPFAPYRQSERSDLYRGYVEKLLEGGQAYYAFDTAEELEKMRERQRSIGVQAPKYNAITRMSMQNSITLSPAEVQRRLAEGVPYVVRIFIDPKRAIRFKDEVRGWVQFQGGTLDDKILLKSDGLPTYHLANVVDDHVMEISHVIRGEEWLPSTPIHCLLYEAFGWELPIFAHLPLLLRSDGTGKLSKRTAAAGTPVFPLQWYDKSTGTTFPGFREEGYLPEALINFLALLGWHPSGDEEVMSLEELCQRFSLDRIQKGGVRFNIEKARWFNQQYLRALSDEAIARQYLLPALEREGVRPDVGYARRVGGLLKSHSTFPAELMERGRYFFFEPSPDAAATSLLQGRWCPEVRSGLEALLLAFERLDPFSPEGLQTAIKETLRSCGLSAKVVVPFLRIAMTGSPVGPDLSSVMAVLGRGLVLDRLREALSWEMGR